MKLLKDKDKEKALTAAKEKLLSNTKNLQCDYQPISHQKSQRPKGSGIIYC